MVAHTNHSYRKPKRNEVQLSTISVSRKGPKGYKLMIKVHNLRGTSSSDKPDGYDSWLDYWEKKTGRKNPQCAYHRNGESADVGAHVQKDSMSDRRWYIVPVCYWVNNQHGMSFSVDEDDLVLENDD